MNIQSKRFAVAIGVCILTSVVSFGTHRSLYSNIDTSSKDYKLRIKNVSNKIYVKYKGSSEYGIINIKSSIKEDTGSNYIIPKNGWQPISLIYGDCGYDISLCEVSSVSNSLKVVEKQGAYVASTSEDKIYTGDGYYVYKTPKLHKIARSLGGDSDLNIVYNIYDYIVDNIKYNNNLAELIKTGELKLYRPDIDEVIDNGQGICIDQASLMLSLLRYKDIKSRLCVGYTENRQYHAWVEVCIDDQWLAFDTSLKRDYRDNIINDYEVMKYY